jgi:hypothetical protein
LSDLFPHQTCLRSAAARLPYLAGHINTPSHGDSRHAQSLSEDLSAARTRIGVLQQEVVDQKAECDTLLRANDALQVRTVGAGAAPGLCI